MLAGAHLESDDDLRDPAEQGEEPDPEQQERSSCGELLLRGPEAQHDLQDAGHQAEPPGAIDVLGDDSGDDVERALKTSSSPSTDASAQKALKGRANAQIAPTTNRKPITTCAQRQVWRIAAIRNSLKAPSRNRMPMRTPTVLTEAGVNRSTITAMISHADTGYQEQPPRACQPP